MSCPNLPLIVVLAALPPKSVPLFPPEARLVSLPGHHGAGKDEILDHGWKDLGAKHGSATTKLDGHDISFL